MTKAEMLKQYKEKFQREAQEKYSEFIIFMESDGFIETIDLYNSSNSSSLSFKSFTNKTSKIKSFFVSFENHDVIGILMSHQKEIPR